MFKHLQKILLLVALLVPWAMQAQITTFPWSIGFETGQYDMTGWKFIDADGDGYGWDTTYLRGNTNPVQAHSGTGMIASASYISSALTPNNWLISPAFTIPVGSTLSLSWWERGQDPSYSDEYYTVYIANDTSMASFLADSVYSGYATGAWVKRTVDLSDYSGQTIYFAFRHWNVTDMFWLDIDDISISQSGSPEVSLPQGLATNVDELFHIPATLLDGAQPITYSWTSTMEDNGDATMTNTVFDSVLDITYSTSGIDTVTVTVTNASGSATATTYVIVVDLDAIDDYPYTTGFETGDDVSWVFENDVTNKWAIGTAAHNTGTSGLYISNDNGTTNTYTNSGTQFSYAYRAFTVEDDVQMAITFDWQANGEGNYDYLRAWVAPGSVTFTSGQAPDGTTSAYNYRETTPAGWIDLGGKMNQQTTWQHVVATPTIAAGTYYLVFMWANDASAGTQPPAAVDNISISELSCPQVADLIIDTISADYMHVAWTAVGDESEWLVTLNDSIVGSTSIEEYEFTDLDANTFYEVGVIALCGNDDSSFVTIVSSRTLAGEPINSFPYVCGFEIDDDNDVNEAAAWIFENGTQSNYWMFGSATNNGGSRSMYITDNGTTNNYSGSESYVFAYAVFYFDSGNYAYSYDWKTQGESSFDFLRAAIVPNAIEFTAGSYNGFNNTSAVPTGGIAIDGANRLNLQSSWQNMSGEFHISQPGAYKLVFLWRNDGSVYNQPPAAIDNVMIARNTCPRPTDIEATNVTADSISISWQAGGSETQWIVSDGQNEYLSNTNSYDLDNLNANTVYHITVQAICSESDSSLPTGISVRTACAAISQLPYTNDFENDPSYSATTYANAFPSCWTRINDASGTYNYYPYLYASASYARSGSVGMYWYQSTTSTYANNEYAVLPPIDLDAFEMTDLTLSFWAKTTSTSYHPAPIVGVMNDPSDTASFIPVYSFSLTEITTDWQMFVVSFADYPDTGTGSYIAIKWPRPASTSYLAIDDIYLTNEWCDMPLNVTALADIDAITLTWESNGGSSFTVYLGDDTITNVTDTFYTFNNLDINTSYNYGVAAECTSSLSMWVTGNARTLAGAPISEFPFVCGFEIDEDNEIDEAVNWVLENGTQTNYWIIDSATNNGGSRSMYITNDGSSNSYSTGSISYSYAYITFAFENGEYAYAYDWKGVGESHNYDFTRVFLTPASESFTAGTILGGSTYSFATSACPAGWIELTQSGATPNTLAQQSTWQTVTGTFPIATAGNYRMVFIWANDGSGGTQPPTAIDNVMIQQNTCPTPLNLTSVYSTTDSVILSWTHGGIETSWEVSYDSNVVVVTDTFYVAEELAASTEYSFSVRAICGDGDTSLFTSCNVRTECGAISVLPYIESFEGLPVGASSSLDCGVPCWSRLDNATQYHFGYVGSPSSWPSGGHTGTGFLYYYMPTTAGTYADWILTILPPIDETVYPINTLQVSFWVKMNSATTTGDILVGVISNVNDDSTFVPLDTVHVSGNVYDLKTAYLSGYTGEGNHIALKYTRNASTTTYYFVDDVTVEPIPACPPVSNIALDGLDSNYLSVTWSENGEATSWTVEYGPTGFTLGNGTTTVVTSLPYLISGLSPNTEYDVYVTPECDGGVAATRMGTFRTANVYVQLPLSCNFEDSTQNALWTLENGTLTNKWYIGTGTNNGGTHGLYISSDNGSTCTYTISSSTMVWAYTDVMIATPGDYGYSFDWKSYGESSLDYIRAALVPVSVTLTAGTTVPSGFSATALPSGWIPLDGGSKLNLQTNWQTQSDVVSIASAGVYHLVFAFRCDGSVGTNPPAAIDNVELAHMTCPRPQNITLSNLVQTSTDVAWTEVGAATSWQYQLNNNSPVIVTDTFCTLANLTANTQYTFRVRSICGAGDTSFWNIYNFRTPCGYTILPYIEDFEGESTSSSSTGSAFVNCWTRLNNGTSYGGYPYVSSSTTYNHTTNGSKGLYWYNTTTTGTYGDYQCAVLPPVDPSVGVDSLQLSFWVKASSASYTPVFQIGVMTDPNNISTFVGVDTVNVTSGTTWMLVEVPLVSYTGTGQYVAVKADRASWTAYLDDFILEYVPTCLIPHNVVSTEASTTSITIDWTDLSTASEWEIRYGANANNTTSVTTTSHPYTVNGLDSLTSYSFEVRAVCTVGDTSRWSTPVYFATELCDNAFAANTGTANSTGYYVPLNNYYNYTLTETIIDSAELAGIGDITSIAYSYAYSTPSTEKIDVDIWLQPTDKTVFASNSDIVALDTTLAVHIYSGSLNCSQGWNYFTMDTVYTWDGHSNLLVIVDDNSGEYDGSSYVFNNSSCTGYKSIAYYSDSDNPNPLSPSSFSGNMGYYQYRPTMKLVSCGISCAAPSALPATDVTYNTATLNWNGNAADYEVAVKAATDATWPAEVAVSGANSYAVTGLAPATIYLFRVRAICDADEGLISDWVEGTFTTAELPCFDPDNLHTTALGYTTATLAWDADESQSNWSIEVWNTAGSNDYTVNGNATYTVTGLSAATTYYAAVKAVCGNGLAESEYSDTIQFTTNACGQVTGVTVSGITENSAVVSWTATGADRYILEYGDQNFSAGHGTSVTVDNATTYTLTNLEQNYDYSVFVRAVCEEGVLGEWSAQQDFTTLQGGGPEGIDLATANSQLSIYPNPATDATVIAVSGVSGEVQITVVDMNGRTVMSDSMSCENDCTKRMEVSGLAQGAYFVRVNGDNLNMVRKLVVK